MISRTKARSVLLLSLTTSVTLLALTGCSWLSKLRLDEVSDNVDYRSNSSSVAVLEIPPGLTKPNFDTTYTLARTLDAAKVATIDSFPPGPRTGRLESSAANNASSSQASTANQGAPLKTVLTQLKDGYPVLAVAGSYAAVWAKTGSILSEAGGVTLHSQSYEQGIYTLATGTTSPPPASEPSQPGIWDRFLGLFGQEQASTASTAATVVQGYRVVISDQGAQSMVLISDAQGQPLATSMAKSLLERLQVQYER